MEFDEADVAQLEAEGQFDETILHEMGHVVGVGTVWEAKGLVTFTGTDCLDFPDPRLYRRRCRGRVRAARRLWYCPGREPRRGPGTRCGHWREAVFDNELMTGFLNPDANPFSRMTIASLGDLGYTVDVSRGEPYSLPACSPNCGNLKAQSLTARMELLEPTHTLTPDGTLRPDFAGHRGASASLALNLNA